MLSRLINFAAIFLCCLTFQFSSELAATNQITAFGHPNGIVADTNEWTCEVVNPLSGQLQTNALNFGTKYIKGASKSLPIVFEFNAERQSPNNLYGVSKDSNLTNVSKFLAGYAIRSSRVISNVSVSSLNNQQHSVYASFFDNKSSGYLAVHTRPGYVMYVELRSTLFDEEASKRIMDKPAELITPLFNPRNLAAILGIDLESLENCTVVEE